MNSKLEKLCTRSARLLFAACLVLPGLAVAEDAAPAAGAPLGVEEHDSGAEVTLLELKRTSGDTVTVKWLYENGGEEKKRIDPLISEDYYLVDAAAKKKYFVVKDSSGKEVAGTHRGYNHVEIEPGKTYEGASLRRSHRAGAGPAVRCRPGRPVDWGRRGHRPALRRQVHPVPPKSITSL